MCRAACIYLLLTTAAGCLARNEFSFGASQGMDTTSNANNTSNANTLGNPNSGNPNLPYGGVASVVTGADNDSECALLNNQQIKCWGYNPNGHLGYGDTLTRGLMTSQMGANLPFVNVDAAHGVTEVCSNGGDGAYGHTCALLDSGAVKCWGANSNGQLGYGDTKQREAPEATAVVPLPGGLTTQHISCGYDFTCAVLADGNAACWGSNYFGSLGVGDNNDRWQPTLVQLPVGRSVTQLVAGSNHTCAVFDNGNATCWGRNTVGQLGLGDTNDRYAPAGQPSLSIGAARTATVVGPGALSTCMVRDDGQVLCWGDNSRGELGVGDTNQRLLPTPITMPVGVTAASVATGGSNSACLTSTVGMVYCWGRGNNGELGLENPNTQLVAAGPVNVGTGRTVTSLAMGNYSTCAVLDDQTAKCWGGGDLAQLGLGDPNTRGNAPGTMGDALPITPLW